VELDVKIMKRLLFNFVLLISIVSTSCTKEDLICGLVNGGGFDTYSGTYYLKVDNKSYWVDMKTYDSYFIGDEICLE